MEAVGDALADELAPLLALDPAERRRRRRDKFLAMGRAPEKAG
jgi:acetyl-CoA carboxylase alpha subunit